VYLTCGEKFFFKFFFFDFTIFSGRFLSWGGGNFQIASKIPQNNSLLIEPFLNKKGAGVFQRLSTKKATSPTNYFFFTFFLLRQTPLSILLEFKYNIPQYLAIQLTELYAVFKNVHSFIPDLLHGNDFGLSPQT
jgi:hypothetical protein